MIGQVFDVEISMGSKIHRQIPGIGAGGEIAETGQRHIVP